VEGLQVELEHVLRLSDVLRYPTGNMADGMSCSRFAQDDENRT